MIIYQARFPNGKLYIGQTSTNLSVRIRTHKCNAVTHKKRSALYEAIRKYGFEKVIWEKLEECVSWEEMQGREKYLIEINKTIVPNGYNLAEGGMQPRMSEKTKKKISLAHLGRIRGSMSEAHRKKIGDALRGKPQPKLIGNKNHFGHIGAHWKLSEDNKKNMSIAALNAGTGKWMKRVWEERRIISNV